MVSGLTVSPLPAPGHPRPGPAARGPEAGGPAQPPASCPHKPASVGLPGARAGAGTWNSRFLSGPDAGRQPRPALRTSPDQVPGGRPGRQGAPLSWSEAAWEPTGQGVCGHSPLPPAETTRPLPVGFLPEDLVLREGPGASI